jgi:ubiquinone biosynthesis protein UbiJ
VSRDEIKAEIKRLADQVAELENQTADLERRVTILEGIILRKCAEG